MAVTADDDKLIQYLKASGTYRHLAVAAGIAELAKDATAGDVHVPSTNLKQPPAASAADVEPKTISEHKVEELMASGSAKVEEAVDDLAKVLGAIAAADPVFFAKRGNLYVARPVMDGSAQRLYEWAQAQGIKNVVPPGLMHVTQVHSSANVDTTAFKPAETLLEVGEGRWLSKLGKGNALVMFFQSPEMQDRFKQAAAAGASWDFPTFMPHITLSYDAGGPAEAALQDWGMMQAPDFPIQLGPEEFKDDNASWTEDNGLVAKMDGGDVTFDVAVSKVLPDQQMIFGWASVSEANGVVVIDKQGDIIPIEELEKAAYEFTLYSRQHGDMHARVGTGRLVESMVFTPEKAALGIVAKNENGEQVFGWWTGFRVDDPGTWAQHKAGKLPEFSIGGRATPHTV